MRLFFGDHVLDIDRRELRRRDEPVPLAPQAFDLLIYLLVNRDRVVTKDNLIETVWGGRIVSESALTTRINAVRKAIGDSGAGQHLIRTIARKGVRFVGKVREEQDPPTAADSALHPGPEPLLASDKPSIDMMPYHKMSVARVSEAARVPRMSVVVLPFANLSNDPEHEHFADGITDDLTIDLTRISGGFVIARRTAFTYKGKSLDVKRIGLELGVRYVVEGSIRPAGDEVRINVQLTDAVSGTHIWAERLYTDRANLAPTQDEITERLARALCVELVRDIGRRIDNERAANPDAGDLVMSGRALRLRPASAGNRQQALQNFELALKIDPCSVDAKIGIASTLVANLADGWSGSIGYDMARAEQLLLEVVAQGVKSSQARVVIGMLRRVQNRWNEAKMVLQGVISLDRNNADALSQLGLTLMLLGEPEAAIPHIETAIRLNPHDPNTAIRHWGLGGCHLLLGGLDRGLHLLTKARAENPQLWYVHLDLAGALAISGELKEARAVLAKAIELKPEMNSLACLRAYPGGTNPVHWALYEKTVALGLRRAGFPDK
jgi:adenylate cyclase